MGPREVTHWLDAALIALASLGFYGIVLIRMSEQRTPRRLPESAESLVTEFGFMRLSKVAEALGVSRTILSSEIKAGRLPARYAGRACLIARPDLVKWLDALPAEQPFQGKAKLATMK